MNIIFSNRTPEHLRRPRPVLSGVGYPGYIIINLIQVKGAGRPKAGVWSNGLIPASKEISYSVTYSLQPYNSESAWAQCLCIYCKDVIVGPLVFKNCEHGSCRACFIENNFKKSIVETRCAKCGVGVESSSDITASAMLQNCIDNLNIKCNHG